MSSTTSYKLIRMGVMIALVAGSAVACHYKAGSQYADGTTTSSDSMNTTNTTMNPADATATPATTPGTATPATMPDQASTMPAATASTSSVAKTTDRSVTKAKFSRGRTSITAPKIYSSAEIAPQFPGGQRALDSYINDHVNYPQQAIDDDVTGTIHVSFIIDEQGHVTKAKVMDARNVSDGLDQEALRVVRNMPDWQPGKVKGKRVKTRLELPISFQVES